MTTTQIYPTNAEAAALDLIVTAAEEATGSTAFRAALQDFCGLLQAEGTLAGLAWPDARQVAAVISYDVVTVDDGRGRSAAASSRDSSSRPRWNEMGRPGRVGPCPNCCRHRAG